MRYTMHTGLAGPKMNLSLPLADRYINLTLILFYAIHDAYWVSRTKDEFVSSLSRSVHKFDLFVSKLALAIELRYISTS